MTLLPPAAALAHAARLLAEHGFTHSAENTRGDTRYLHRPGCVFALRLSNHPRTPKQRKRRTDVLTSMVIRDPRSPEQMAILVAAALRDFEGALRQRKGSTAEEA